MLTNGGSCSINDPGVDLLSCRALSFLRIQPGRISASAEESHQFNSGAPSAAILYDVVTGRVWLAFLDLHCLVAYNAGQEFNQWAFIVVQMKSLPHGFPDRS
jgi:hypothetical protein